jgi:hypothetical protein
MLSPSSRIIQPHRALNALLLNDSHFSSAVSCPGAGAATGVGNACAITVLLATSIAIVNAHLARCGSPLIAPSIRKERASGA